MLKLVIQARTQGSTTLRMYEWPWMACGRATRGARAPVELLHCSATRPWQRPQWCRHQPPAPYEATLLRVEVSVIQARLSLAAFSFGSRQRPYYAFSRMGPPAKCNRFCIYRQYHTICDIYRWMSWA
jgi:hypothetical protein